MRTLTTALLASAFIAGPAFACSFGKTAGHKMSNTTASLDQPVIEEAMSTFDPVKKPQFEDEKAEAVDQPIKLPKEPEVE